MAGFVHLHVHSDNSLQDAAVSVMALADRAEELGMTHMALTDHGNMFGAMEFLAACKETVKIVEGKEKHVPRERPILPIFGCEAYVSPGSRLEKTGSEGDNKYYHLVLLAENHEGYRNLVKLCSCAYTEGFYYRPRIDDEILARYHRGLIGLSACVSGEIPRLIRAGNTRAAEEKALFYRDLFGEGNFFLEIQDHGIPAETLKCPLSQRDINREIAAISGRTGIPLAATNDVHYLAREDAAAHDVLLCIGTGKLRTEERRKKYYGDQFYLKSEAEMARLFPDYPEALSNTLVIAERCVQDFLKPNKEGRLEYSFPTVETRDLPSYLPECEIPPGFSGADSYLRHLTTEGLDRRYRREKEGSPEKWEELQKRAEYELDVIIQMGFTGYFLIVADFINWAKEHGIDVGPGRGSGAGSIVAYALRITDIDPIKYGLLFERFLNPERISMPDFDVDFCNERREEVISHVTEKYGKERVAQIITFGTLGAKAVIKDVARTLNISISESDMISKLIPARRTDDPNKDITLEYALETEPRLRELEQDPRYTELFSLAGKLEGLKRHSSFHAAGVVIGKSDLTDYVPLYRDSKTGGIATQYTMGFLENCGLVKMDFLGLKTLDVLRHTEALIRRRGPEYAGFDIASIPENDQATFTMLGDGKSFEVFQFESDGMQNILRQAKPGKIEDLIALNALYRPGPMDNIPQYIDSKNGRREITYPDPSLEEVLKETYGVIVYQEQVMQVARIVAGFTLGHADELRRAMGKKNMEKMVKEKEKFISGAVQRGYARGKADDIFELLIPFAGYGFNKSHAAAYAILAYQTAYLKANFPAEFMAANLSNEIYSANKDKLSECIGEARKMGLTIDPPDINRSDKLFAVVDGRIIFGFLGIKGLGDSTAEEIIRGRTAEGPYRDFMDFLDRTDIKAVGKKGVELLIKTGAFDLFGVNRATLLANMEAAIDYAQNKKDEGKFGQASLFEDTGEKTFSDFTFTDMPDLDRTSQLGIEKELIGFYFSGHPLDEYRELWDRYVKLDASDLDHAVPGNYVLIGIVKSLKAVTDKTGKPMAFGTLEDYRGEVDMAFFGDVWTECRDRIHQDEIIALKGRLDQRRGKMNFQVQGLVPLRELKENPALAALGSAKPAVPESSALSGAELSAAMGPYKNAWEQLVTVDLGAPEKAEGEYVLIGYLTSIRTLTDKNGNEMAFAALEDYRGKIDLVFFARCWEINKDKIAEKNCAALKGKINRRGENVNFLVSSVLDLGKLRRSTVKPPADPAARAAAPEILRQELHIRLHTGGAVREKDLSPLRDFLIDHPGPTPVFIHVPPPDDAGRETVIRTGMQIAAAGQEQLAALEENPAVAEIWVA
jgi:DNA polymerase-3 subunit alpha